MEKESPYFQRLPDDPENEEFLNVSVKLINLAQSYAGSKRISQSGEMEKKTIEETLRQKPFTSYWLIDVHKSVPFRKIILIKTNMTDTDEDYVVLSFSYGFEYSHVQVESTYGNKEDLRVVTLFNVWKVPSTLNYAILKLKQMEKVHHYLWTDFFNDAPIQAKVEKSRSFDTSREWSSILYTEYSSHLTYFYGLDADDMNYISRIWVMQELIAGSRNSITNIKWCPLVKLINQVSHSQHLDLVIAWAMVSIATFGCYCETVAKMRETIIKACSGCAGHGAGRDLSHLYDGILRDEDSILKLREALVDSHSLRDLYIGLRSLIPSLHEDIVSQVVESVYETISIQKRESVQLKSLHGLFLQKAINLQAGGYLAEYIADWTAENAIGFLSHVH